MNPFPPSAVSRPRRALVTIACLALAGCSPWAAASPTEGTGTPPSPPRTASSSASSSATSSTSPSASGTAGSPPRLVVLQGPGGSRRLLVTGVRPAPSSTTIGLPPAAAVASGLSVAADGRIALALPGDPPAVALGSLPPRRAPPGGDLTLRVVPLGGPGVGAGEAAIGSVAWSPSGDRLAVVSGDPTRTLGRLYLADAAAAAGRPLGAPLVLEPVAPLWLDGARLAVLVRDLQDRVALRTVAASDGAVLATRLSPAASLARSGDGSTIAVALRGTAFVRVGDLAPWVADGTLRGTVIQAPAPDGSAGAMALDATGAWLAVAWQRPGTTTSVLVYERATGWRSTEVSRGPDDGVGLGWLP